MLPATKRPLQLQLFSPLQASDDINGPASSISEERRAELIRKLGTNIGIFSRVLYNPLCSLVSWSVRPSVTLCFFGVYGRFWGYCSCPTAWLVYFITAPDHPHAT